MSDLESKRAQNRTAFPVVAKMVDEVRATFGDVVVLGGIEEAGCFGKSVGTFDVACEGCDGRVCAHPDVARVWCGHRLVFPTKKIEIVKGGGRG